MTWTWAHVPIILLGLTLMFAPVFGAWWARDWRPVHCERCSRELVGSPPRHRLSDRGWCRHMALAEGEQL
jgi:hypothetical protein